MTAEVATETTHRARVVWEATKEDNRAHRVDVGGQTVVGSSAPEFGGDAKKADPEGLFVAALSACHMLWFLDFARRARLRVTSYEDEAEGRMDGRRFRQVALRPRVGFADAVDRALLEELHHRAHEACFIANSVSCLVKIEPR